MAAQTKKQRLDQLVVSRGLAPTREKARALILAGQVLSDGVRLDKPGTRLPEDRPLELMPGRRYVGRGALKLVGALESFGVDVRDKDALDVGASTGGFTQVLLEAGARRVVALDVGKGQLDWSLRNDPRVHPIEGVNARHLQQGGLPFSPELCVVDVSFISLRIVLPPVADALAAGGEILALVKPQFEVGRESVGRGGIVKDPALHEEVLATMIGLAREHGWGVLGLCASRLRGAEGNQEYFIHLAPDRAGRSETELEADIRRVVAIREDPR